MSEIYKINRLDYLILQSLYASDCKDYYSSMTITELMEDNSDENGRCALGARMTIYKKLKKLAEDSYISKGVVDNHADTYYLTEKGIKLIEQGGNA